MSLLRSLTQIEMEDFDQVQLPPKMIGAQTQEFDLLPAAQQEVVRLACNFSVCCHIIAIVRSLMDR